MDPICTIVDDILAPMLRGKFMSGHQLALGSRDWNKITLIARTHCLEEIWARHFGTPGGAFFGQDMSPDRLRFLGDQLYVTTEHWAMALGQVAPYLFGDTAHRIRQAIYRMWSNGSISYPTKWRKVYKSDCFDPMQDGRTHAQARSNDKNGSSSRRDRMGVEIPNPDLIRNECADDYAGSLALYEPDYNYVIFTCQSTMRDRDVIQRFSAVIHAELVRDVQCMIPPPNVSEIATIIREWTRKNYTGQAITTVTSRAPACKPPKEEGEDESGDGAMECGYRFSETEKVSDMICIVEQGQGIGFMTSFLKPNTSASGFVRTFVQDVLRKNHGAFIRTMRDAKMDSHFKNAKNGDYYHRSIIYGNPSSSRPHLFDSIELSEDDKHLPGFSIQYDILKMHIPMEKMEKIFNKKRHQFRPGEKLVWPYTLEHLAIMSRRHSVGVLEPPCYQPEFLKTMRLLSLGSIDKLMDLDIACSYMSSHLPNMAKGEIRDKIASSDSHIWNCAPWSTIIFWSMFLGVPPKDLEKESTWRSGESNDIDFRIECMQPEAVRWLRSVWKHPILSFREWFHSPEAQYLAFRKAIRDQDPETSVSRFYKIASNHTYKKRMETTSGAPMIISPQTITDDKIFEESISCNGHASMKRVQSDVGMTSEMHDRNKRRKKHASLSKSTSDICYDSLSDVSDIEADTVWDKLIGVRSLIRG
jgi:hypothetical protein